MCIAHHLWESLPSIAVGASAPPRLRDGGGPDPGRREVARPHAVGRRAARRRRDRRCARATGSPPVVVRSAGGTDEFVHCGGDGVKVLPAIQAVAHGLTTVMPLDGRRRSTGAPREGRRPPPVPRRTTVARRTGHVSGGGGPMMAADLIPAPTQGIAYFSMEIAVDDALPSYSGGLGVLAGDFLRSAADLGLPVVGGHPALPRRVFPPAARPRRAPRPRPPSGGRPRTGCASCPTGSTSPCSAAGSGSPPGSSN